MFDDKEPSSDMQTRVLIAFALSALVLVLFAPKGQKPADKGDKKAPSAQGQQVAQAPAPAQGPASAPSAPATAKPGGTLSPAQSPPSQSPPSQSVVQESNETEISIESDLYDVRFTNRGGVATSWVLTNFKDGLGKRLDVVNPIDVAQVGWPLSIYVDDAEARSKLAQGLYVGKTTSHQAPATVTFEYSDGSLSARKEFHFERSSYVVRISTEVTRDGKPLAHEVSWRGGFGDRTAEGYSLASVMTLSVGEKLDHKPIKDVKTDYRPNGPFSYLSLEDHFFAAIFMPGGAGDAAPVTFPSATVFKNNFTAAPGQAVDLAGISVGGEPVNHLRAYIGPKDMGILKTISPDPRGDKIIEQGGQAPSIASVIDFGWFALVAVPLFMGMKWIYVHIVANYGWAIVILTIGINFVLFPLKLSSMKSSMNMQKLAPQVKAIQDKYKKYKMNDPKKAEANEEVMALYKKEGVNPLGGCIPMLLQLPFLYGFYKVLSQSIEMRQAPWILWISDLSQHEAGWFHLLPVLMIGTMVILQKMTPQTSADPVQQKMMMMMPVMMGVMFYNVSSGLVLYWLAGNVVQLGQQWFINRTTPA